MKNIDAERLRDAFAGQAMQAYLSYDQDPGSCREDSCHTITQQAAAIAAMAYAVADAMLDRRNLSPEESGCVLIETRGLSGRALRAITELKVNCVSDLKRISRRDVISLRHCGMTTYREIKKLASEKYNVVME